MTVYKNLPSGFIIKSRPKTYESDGMTVGGNKGWIIASAPRKYPLTSQQKKVKRIAAECGIYPGIDRAELRRKMKECVGPKMAGIE